MGKRRAYEIRYFVTDVASVPVVRIPYKTEAYREAVGPGWGTVDWYSPSNGFSCSVARDRNDREQAIYCDEDARAALYSIWGEEFIVDPGEKLDLRKAPARAQTAAVITSGPNGFDFWENRPGAVRFFVTYAASGLVDTYRLDGPDGKPYDGEVEILFSDLQSEEEYAMKGRDMIPGTFEYARREEAATA